MSFDNFADWCDNFPVIEYKLFGRRDYLEKKAFLNLHDKAELEDIYRHIKIIENKNERIQKERENNKKINDAIKLKELEKQKEEEELKLMKKEEFLQKFYNNKDKDVILTDDLIYTINKSITYSKTQQQLYFTNFIKKLSDYINEFKSILSFKKLNVLEFSKIEKDDFIEQIKLYCKECSEYNYNQYIYINKIKNTIIKYLQDTLALYEKNKLDLSSVSSEKRRVKKNEWAIKKKFCECCEKDVAASNWSKHITTEKHKNNL